LLTPDNPAINYYGRFDFSNPKSPRFDWSGTTIEFAVSGTATVGMEMADGAGYYDVEIDGKTQAAAINANSAGSMKYPLATGLSTDKHLIRIIRRNEPYPNIATFGGVYLADGGILVATPKPARKMEFVGDSWTAGYFNEACVEQQANTNTNKAWARLTSKAFHAQDIILAESGIGLVKSLGGKTVIPRKYLDTFDTIGTVATPAWDFTWKPDIVSIFLGINDKNAGATDPQFTTAMHAFVTTIRGHYPDAAILFISATGSMDAAAKSAVAAETTSLGHKRVFWQECKTVGTGCQYHPTLAQDQEIANTMIARIMGITGWDTTLASVPIRGNRTGRRRTGQIQSARMEDRIVSVTAPGIGASSPLTVLSADGRIAGKLTLDASGESRWKPGPSARGALWIGSPVTGWTRIGAGR
jgi:lysophospholipase L1-like esterase